LFGLHANADITTNQSRSDDMLSKILSIQSQTARAKGSRTPEDINEEKALFIQSKIPKSFDLELIEMK